VVAAERGETEVLRLGNANATRDFLDVRDVVRGYLLLMQRGTRGGVYNLCSGRGRSIARVVEDVLALSSARPRIEIEQERLRSTDIPTLIGDNGRMRALGWAPTIDWTATLSDLLEYWRSAA
jgi:GDP-4-dehydro-6-deoxy-D-mannose reductase